MALLPDLGAASLYAVAAFLLILGVLVVFVESVRGSLVALIGIVSLAVAVGLSLVGEIGVALIVLGIGAAFVANHVFEWLTTR